MPKGDRDEAFSEIRKGDKVYYFNKQLQEHSGKAIMLDPKVGLLVVNTDLSL